MLAIVTSLLTPIWALLAPWLGPLLLAAAPFLARARNLFGDARSVVSGSIAPLIACAAVGIAIWMWMVDRRDVRNSHDAAMRQAGAATCDAAASAATIDAVRIQRERAERAERATDDARERWEKSERDAAEQITALERQIAAARPSAGSRVVYPAEIARKLNQ